MYSFFDFQFWGYFLYFLTTFFLSCFIPGYVILRFLPFKSPTLRIVLASVTGIVLWAAQGYILGYLQMRFLTYGYLVVFILLFFKMRGVFIDDFKKLKTRAVKVDRIAILILIAGVLLQTFPIFFSGMKYEDGVRFFHVNATDGILHLGYIQSMVNTFPPQEPGINSPLVNYHYWSDLVIAEFARVWHQPVIHLFYQFIVPIVSLLTGLATYLLIITWGGSRNVGRWALFLLFFAGDGAYLFMLLLHQKIGFTSPAIDNGLLQFVNMPHAMAKMIFVAALIPLYLWIKTKDVKYGIFAMGLFSVLVGFKVYYGIFVAIGLICLGIAGFIKGLVERHKKKVIYTSILQSLLDQKYLIGLTLVFAAIGACIYFPPNKASGGLFYSPLEWPKLFLGAGALEFEEWWLRRQVYEQANNLKALIVYDGIAIGITLVSIYGTRLLGLSPNKEIVKKVGLEMLCFLIPATLIFNFLGLYTLQESGLFNVYNFFVVSAIVLSLFSAFTLAWMQKIKIVGVVFSVIFIVVTIPRILFESHVLYEMYTSDFSNSKIVTNSELETLSYINKNTQDGAIIQTHIKNGWDQVTPYSIFFANRSSYLTGTRLLETHNQPVKEREADLEILFKSPNAGEFAENMEQLGVDYVVIKKDNDQSLSFPIDEQFLTIPFENSEYLLLTTTNK